MTSKKKTRKQHTISLDEYSSIMEDYLGFCTECGAFRDCVEPDACRYTCEECGEPSVYGTDMLLMMGLVTEGEDHESTN